MYCKKYKTETFGETKHLISAKSVNSLPGSTASSGTITKMTVLVPIHAALQLLCKLPDYRPGPPLSDEPKHKHDGSHRLSPTGRCDWAMPQQRATSIRNLNL